MMEIVVDGKKLFELTELQKKVLSWEISEDLLDEDLKRRLEWVLMHKYEQTFARFKSYGDALLATNKVALLPADREAYINLVCSQPNYEDRKARDAKLNEAKHPEEK